MTTPRNSRASGICCVSTCCAVSQHSPLSTLLDTANQTLPNRVNELELTEKIQCARLSYTQGSVSFQPAGTEDWVTAGLNRPITTGDKMWADNDGRVELQLDGSLIRLSNNTGFSFLNLCLAKIGSAFEINNIQRGRVTCCIYEIQPSWSFGDGQVSFPLNLATFLPRPAESRNNFTSKTGIPEFTFFKEGATFASTALGGICAYYSIDFATCSLLNSRVYRHSTSTSPKRTLSMS